MSGRSRDVPGFQVLDPLRAPLSGSNLIEASAGTGKTHTLSRLFLRLLLEKDLSVNEILVVTYTKAAAEELRFRIRRLLLRMRSVLSGEGGGDPLLAELAERVNRSDRMREQLDEAVSHFDEAAVFTIHGFCQRVLEEKSFESGGLFDTALIPDQRALAEEIVQDFWRRHFYPAPPELIALARNRNLEGPTSLLNIIEKGLVYPDLVVEDPSAAPGWEGLEGLRLRWRELQRRWPRVRGEAEALLRDGSLNKNKIGRPEVLIEGMRAYLDSPWIGLPLPSRLGRLRNVFLQESAKKGARPPEHPFFAEWEEFWGEAEGLQERLEGHIQSLIVQAFHYLRQELAIRKRKRNLWSFDDLLVRLRKALRGSGGEALAAGLRLRFKAALIDEFQDTDPVQYEIFSRIFSTNRTPLFLIGDPKQAIYGFRGADLFAYIKATREVENRYTLSRNWRSVPGLVQAVNRLFERRHPPFLVEEIPYVTATPASPDTGKRLRIEDREPAPLQAWYLPVERYEETGEDMSQTRANRLVVTAVGGEIARLLRLGHRGLALIGDRPLKPRDLAVLVRTHREARQVQETLRRLRIPSVLYSTENVFDSAEAQELSRLLAALAEPGRETLIRGALTTDLLGVNGVELERLSGLEQEWEERVDRFRRYGEEWQRGGVYYLLRRVLNRERVRERVLQFPDGERRLTNLLHLMELLHQAEVEKGLGRMELRRWLFHQRDGRDLRLEEHQLRLESDAEALKIVTIHKCKGLEYPVVFCPFLWGRRGLSAKEPFLYHDEADGWRLHLVLQPEQDPRRALAERELSAENLRLLYVALTRARSGCTFVWGRIRGADRSAPAYLLGLDGAGRSDEGGKGKHSTQEPGAEASFRRPLEEWAGDSGGAVQVEEMPKWEGEALEEEPSTPLALSARTFDRPVSDHWRVASFTLLTKQTVGGTWRFDGKPLEGADYDADSGGLGELVPGEAPQGLAAFPRGTGAGIFLHALLEELDFTGIGSESFSAQVASKLRDFGFTPHWESPLVEALIGMLTAPLLPSDSDFTLSRVTRADRLNEMGFYFPLRLLSPERLAGLLGRFRPEGFEAGDLFPAEELVFAPVQGYMKGYIDLVFQYGGRFYLTDWKSNYLGPNPAYYRPAHLAQAMAHHHYYLQYLLYVLALHQFLSYRLPGYEYERHFGGVFYVFLRGVDPDRGPDCGIFRDRPSAGLVEALARDLIAGD